VERETRAVRLADVTFFALAAYLVAESIHDLVSLARPEQSVAGLAVTAAAMLIMPGLAIAKRRAGQALGNRTCSAGTMCNGPGCRSAAGWCLRRHHRDAAAACADHDHAALQQDPDQRQFHQPGGLGRGHDPPPRGPRTVSGATGPCAAASWKTSPQARGWVPLWRILPHGGDKPRGAERPDKPGAIVGGKACDTVGLAEADRRTGDAGSREAEREEIDERIRRAGSHRRGNRRVGMLEGGTALGGPAG